MGFVTNRWQPVNASPGPIGPYTVSITIVGSRVTNSGGALIQPDLVGPMTPVVLSAPRGYAVANPIITGTGIIATFTGNGCMISGTPTSDVSISVTDTTLISNSDQTKILTYCVASDFISSASSWGSDYTYPIRKGPGGLAWSLTNSDKSVRCRGGTQTGADMYFYAGATGKTLNNITVYSAFKYYASSSANRTLMWRFNKSYPYFLDARNGQKLGYSFSRSITDYYDVAIYSGYHVYAVNIQKNPTTGEVTVFHVLDNETVRTSSTFTWANQLIYYPSIYVFSNRYIDIQLFATVEDAESQQTVINNVANIKSKLEI